MTEGFKTEYQFLVFTQLPSTGKTEIWQCWNKHHSVLLGTVKWYGAWRQYCYFTRDDTEVVYSIGCMNDICHFINQLKNRRK